MEVPGVHIGFCQFEVAFGDWEANAAAIREGVGSAAGAGLLVFPELATTGYEFLDAGEVRGLAEPFGTGPLSTLLVDLAARSQMSLVCGYAEAAEEGCYNACMLARPDGELFNYRKIHLFDREQELFLPGDAAPPVVDTPAGRVGLMICFDWFFPEVARSLALRGAQILAHPSNLVLPWCQRAMFARSVENRVFSITANRIGRETRAGRDLTFTGGSQVMSPRGETLAQSGAGDTAVQLVEGEVSLADDKSVTSRSDLFASRRPELYGL